jgi:hypothetical protein
MFGFLDINEWSNLVNIGSIMQISHLTMQDLFSSAAKETELTREAVIEKIALVATSYFCIATEKRFIHQQLQQTTLDKISQYKMNEPNKESEYWHAKALEIATCFLPVNCPLLNHILLSYQKHYSPVQQVIVLIFSLFIIIA